MKYPLYVALLLAATSAVAEFEPDVVMDSCDTPGACAAKLINVINRTESVNVYPTGPEVGVLKRLLALGDDGMQQIMLLLESDDPHISRDAAIALREADFILTRQLNIGFNNMAQGVAQDVPSPAESGCKSSKIKQIHTSAPDLTGRELNSSG